MAGIKLEDTAATGLINKDGYINVTEEIFITEPIFDDIADYDSDDLVKFLRGNGRTDGSNNVTYDTGKNLRKKKVKLTATYDDDANRRGKRKFNIHLPEDNPGAFDYLDNYIDALIELKTDGRDEDARRFLFGVMLLTRCR